MTVPSGRKLCPASLYGALIRWTFSTPEKDLEIAGVKIDARAHRRENGLALAGGAVNGKAPSGPGVLRRPGSAQHSPSLAWQQS